jgi:chromosomal replication initiation ATPase DnaA
VDAGIFGLGRQLRLNLEHTPSFRREDFITSASNAEGVAAVDAWPNWLSGALTLVGPEGSGKTHLAAAWAEAHGGLFLDHLAVHLVPLSELGGQPVAVDDADQVNDETMFHLINLAAAEGFGLLLTSRAWPRTWSCALPDLRSRLNALRVVQLHEPDDLVLRGVLERFFRQRLIVPPDDVLDYLVRRIERSAPIAREVVARIDEAASAEARAVTVALARKVIEDDEAETGELFV